MKGLAHPDDIKAHAEKAELHTIHFLDINGQIVKEYGDALYAHLQFKDGKNFRLPKGQMEEHFHGYNFTEKFQGNIQ